MEIKLVKQFKRGPYIIKHEIWSLDGNPDTFMKAAYSVDGVYIGLTKDAHHLYKTFGIEEFYGRTPQSVVCTIGYSPKNKKWYGWSHRAIHGFKTKRAAINFAEKVS